ncbi:MAG TPA: shikimate kinase [Bryobacteraceae bacterium]|nr:shikimate kinase [Bryobacteraceae bacterium]
MRLKLKRTPGIYLVGFMASGKSTVGRMYADEIGWRFADLDDDIESAEKTSISDLFSHRGEEAFRCIEGEALERRVQSIRRGTPTVLALGGGTFTREDNVQLVTDHGITVWIDTSFDVVSRRVSMSNHRPLARDPERFAALYEARRSSYSKAEYRVELKVDDSREALRQLIALNLLDD